MLNKTKILFVYGTSMTTEQNTDSPVPDLKAARQNSGLTLKEIFERTRISVRNLKAMENGQFHLLPAPIYTRNFIKIYAKSLGVDSKPVLQRYEDYLQTLIKERKQNDSHPPRVPLAAMLDRHKTFLWIALIAILIAAVAIFASVYNKPSPEAPLAIKSSGEAASEEAPAQNTSGQNLPIAIDPATLTGDQPTVGPQVLPSPTAPSPAVPEADVSQTAPGKKKTGTRATTGAEETFSLVITATEQTWIRMQADDREPYEVLLDAGEKISQKASGFNMDIGNAGGVKIQVDGKTIENLGKSGQVIHLRFP